MSYKVLARFQDTDGKTYEVGDNYSKKLDKKREEVLTTSKNAYREPFLKATKPKEVKKKKGD